MSTQFTQAVNHDGFSQKLDTISSAITDQSKILTASLEAHPRRSLNLFFRWIARPVGLIFGKDTLAHYRVKAVATNMLQFVQANIAFLHDTNKQRVFAILNALNEKTKQKYSALIDTIRQQIDPLKQSEAPQVEVPALATTNLALQATSETATVIAQSAASAPVVESAPAIVQDTISDADLASAKTALTSCVANLAHDIHKSIASKEKTFMLSPAALLDTANYLVQTATGVDSDNTSHALGLSTTAPSHVAVAVKSLKDDLKAASVHQINCLAIEKAPANSDTLTKLCGLSVCVEKVTTRESARRQVNKIASDKTEGAFTELLAPKAATTCALAHATALKASFGALSDPNSVEKPFTFSNGEQVFAKLLSFNPMKAKYLGAEKFTLVEIPLQNGLSKVIVFPNDAKDFQSLHDQLEPLDLEQYRKDAKEMQIKLFMPETSSQHKINMLPYLTNKKLASSDLTAVFTGVNVQDAHNSSDAVSSDPAQEVVVNKSFYTFIMKDNLSIVQGQVDSKEGISLAATPSQRRFFGLVGR